MLQMVYSLLFLCYLKVVYTLFQRLSMIIWVLHTSRRETLNTAAYMTMVASAQEGYYSSSFF